VVENDVHDVLQKAHDAGGHFGAESTLAAIREIVWWPTMRKNVFHWVRSCEK
ncbi:hypothetical protein B0O80DRAFT_359742, partial [Mortierella sp. GBAus27b]